MTPDPKRQRIKLSKKEWTALRDTMWVESGGRCEQCHRWLPLEGGLFDGPHLHHIKSRGAGGDDTRNNLKLLCLNCHQTEHSGG